MLSPGTYVAHLRYPESHPSPLIVRVMCFSVAIEQIQPTVLVISIPFKSSGVL